MLDNKSSAGVKDIDEEQKIRMQLVPPYSHRHNIAVRAIKT